MKILNRFTGELILELEIESLRRANLSGSDLSGSDLSGSDLSGADLSGADLSGSDLSGSDLYWADLYCANLSGSDLSGANLSGSDLSGANLSGVDLSGANLSGVDLNSETKIDINSIWFKQTRILPDGDLIGYKKCRNGIIVKLLVTKESKRSHAFGRKCRADFVEVLEIFGAEEAISQHDDSVIYKVGETVKCKYPFSEEWYNECASGIHFFITKEEAENY